MKTKTTILSILFGMFYQLSFSQTAGPNGTTSYDIKGANVYYANGAILSVFSGVATPSAVGGSITLTPGSGYSSNGSINLNGLVIAGYATFTNIGIGTAARTDYKLAVLGNVGVNGIVTAEEVDVKATAWSDHVFGKNYKLMSIGELENFIKTKEHLPNVPDKKTVLQSGINVAQMNAILLEKIEEQMLYIIELNNKIEELNKEVKSLKR